MNPGTTGKNQAQTLSGLDRLKQAHRKEFLASTSRLVKSPFSSLMTIFVIAVALLLPALLFVANDKLSTALTEYQNSTRMTLYLQGSVTEAEALEVSNSLLTDPAIDSAVYISEEQALLEFSTSSGFTEILSRLPSNPLPASIEIALSPAGLDQLDALSERLLALDSVESVQIDSQWLQRLQAISHLITTLAQILGLIVVLGLVFIVGNTIRLHIENRKAEIRVIKLVGGTNAFIARPFLYLGLLYGFFGGLLAYLLEALIFLGLSEPMAELAALYGGSFQLTSSGPLHGLLLLLVGSAIGWIAALFSSFRHISAIEL